MEFSYVFVSVPFPNNSRTRLFPSFCVALKTGELNGYPCIIYYVLICARSEQGNAAFVSNTHQKTSLLKQGPYLIKSIYWYIMIWNYYFISVNITLFHLKWLKYDMFYNKRDIWRINQWTQNSMHDLILEFEHIEIHQIDQEIPSVLSFVVVLEIH